MSSKASALVFLDDGVSVPWDRLVDASLCWCDPPVVPRWYGAGTGQQRRNTARRSIASPFRSKLRIRSARPSAAGYVSERPVYARKILVSI